ncbi:MAG: hypothetical protein KC444_10210, partial [Nitrosopumilus sp.]|nr:hypothetical protein [Nitrosopumilus sp.]
MSYLYLEMNLRNDSLLEPSEENFLKDTEELLQDYIKHEIIFDTLYVCTNRQLGKSNYIQKFPSVFECIRRKMYQLCESSEQIEDNTSGGGGSVVHIPGIIDTRIIMKAFLRGHKHVKNKLVEL